MRDTLKRIAAILKKKIGGIECIIEPTFYGRTEIIFDIVFPEQTYSEEFQTRIEPILEELFTNRIIGDTRVALDKIMWR